MPSRDPVTGKRIPGAQQRKRQHQKRQAGPAAARRQRLACARTGEQPASLDPVVEFAKCGPPPLDDTADLIRWGAKMLGVSIYLVATDSEMDLPDRIRFVNDGCAKLGMIRDKATEQQKLELAAAAFDQKRGKAQKPTGGPKSLAGIQKPATARA